MRIALAALLALAVVRPLCGDSPAIDSLRSYLAQPLSQRPELQEQSFATQALNREDARQAYQLLWQEHVTRLKSERAAEMADSQITVADKTLKFVAKKFGQRPERGHSLWISMHGGGNAPAAVNDRQWQNQQRLYQLDEGIYIAPRAPTNTWNLWHEAHIDDLFDRLIANYIALEGIDANRVYLTGYSAGGDGVYQLAPRMADRFAAAAMMAGHPNEASPLGLRNLPFAIQVGAKDSAYNRNKVAEQWHQQLQELKATDNEGYETYFKLHEGLPHWMNGLDAAALPWMAKFQRNPQPKKVVWRQDDVTHQRFYWLAIDKDSAKTGVEIIASITAQTIEVTAPTECSLSLRLKDEMLDLDQAVQVKRNGVSQSYQPQRTIATLAKTLAERGDPESVYCAELPLSPQ